MTVVYKQVAFKVHPEEYEAFEGFVRRLGLSPYAMLRLLVESWASAEKLMRRLEEGKAGELEALEELGKLVERIKTVAQLNGLFSEMMERVSEHYGLKLPITTREG